jgi:hypothetical protein
LMTGGPCAGGIVTVGHVEGGSERPLACLFIRKAIFLTWSSPVELLGKAGASGAGNVWIQA